MKQLRILNEAGNQRFRDYLASAQLMCAGGGYSDLHVPVEILFDDEFSEPFRPVTVKGSEFASRYDMGKYLSSILPAFDEVSHNHGLWNWLSLFYFDQICPVEAEGLRKVGDMPRYLYTQDYTRFYRHLVRTAVMLHSLLGESSRLFLWRTPDVHGDLTEQLASRQDLLANRPLMDAAMELYFNKDKGILKKGGVTNRNSAGNIRRLAEDVVPQLYLTYDLHQMNPQQIVALLPTEFDKWK